MQKVQKSCWKSKKKHEKMQRALGVGSAFAARAVCARVCCALIPRAFVAISRPPRAEALPAAVRRPSAAIMFRLLGTRGLGAAAPHRAGHFGGGVVRCGPALCSYSRCSTCSGQRTSTGRPRPAGCDGGRMTGGRRMAERWSQRCGIVGAGVAATSSL